VRSTFTLGRIAGIEIGINWSWLVVFGLISWSLGNGVFPQTNPGKSDSTYAAMAIVAAACFFTSLLLHELGHALQAQRENVRIKGITLWLFGGVAKLGSGFPSAAAEFRIAIAGPLVSLVLGVLLLGLHFAAPLPSVVDGVVFWIGSTNLILLVFNLIPALPLDGGRVLRAALWHVWHDFRRATLIAVRVSRALAFLLIVGGFILLGVQGVYSGLWLAFVGWFLLQAASAERRAAHATPPDVLVQSVATNGNGGGFPLVFDDRIVAYASVRPASGAPIGPLPRVEPTTSLVSAYEEVRQAGEERALVVDGGSVVGVLEFAGPSPFGLMRLFPFRSFRV
jgi:Zn-dependent protease